MKDKKMYRCSNCHAPIPYRGYCPTCQSVYRREKYNKEKERKRYLKNRERNLKYAKEYTLRNLQRKAEYAKAYRMLGEDDSLMKAYTKKYKKIHKTYKK